MSAATLGTASLWMGLMPITFMASISSRMVRAPRSAHIAVAAAPPTVSTVVPGPVCVITASAAPVPERSAAPISNSKTLRMNTTNTLKGIANPMAGTADTRATNQLW